MKPTLGFILLAVVMLLGLVSPIDSAPPDTTLKLGGHSVGETLSDFTAAFPKAICGSKIHVAEVMQQTEFLNASGLLGCCLNNSSDVSAFSSHKILFVAYCRVLAIFYNQRLQDVRYVVDAPDIASVLPEFEKTFGPVAIDTPIKLDGLHPKRTVAWVGDHDVLNLSTLILNGERPDDNVVLVHLWRIPH